MFRQIQVPDNVYAFAQKQARTVIECDYAVKHPEDFVKKDFMLTCEEINQAVTRQLPGVVPMFANDALSKKKANVLRLRVIQYADDKQYVIETQSHIKHLDIFGRVKWYIITENGVKPYKDPKRRGGKYQYCYGDRLYSAPSERIRVRDFFYKV